MTTILKVTLPLTATWEDARENVFYSREERQSQKLQDILSKD